MRFHRLLVPLVGVLAVATLVLIVALARGGGAKPKADEYKDLLALKQEAEQLTISGKLAEAHAKYRELLLATQGRPIKDPMVYQIVIEDARFEQNRIYAILMNRQDPSAGAMSRPTTQAGGVAIPAPTGLAETRVGEASPTVPQTTPDRTSTMERVNAPATTRATSEPATTRASGGTATNQAATRAVVGADDVLSAAGESPAAPQPTRFRVVRTPRDVDQFSDAAIGESLARANEFLMSQVKEGQIEQGANVSETYRQGLHALVTYALLSSGQATRDPRFAMTSPRMREMVDRMKQHAMTTDRDKAQSPVTYARSLRAVALALHNRPEDREALKADVQWLIEAQVDGAYTYDDRFVPRVVPADPRRGPRPEREKPPAPDFTLPRSEGPLRDEKGRVIELADGLHDPRTGAELYPKLIRIPPPPSVFDPPRYLPDPATKMGTFIWDNSNSQYAAWAVGKAAETGVEVPDAYWTAVQKHWLSCQKENGQWYYKKGQEAGSLQMTSGGITALLMTHDWLEAPVAGKAQPATPTTAAIAGAMMWLEAGDHAVTVTNPQTIYLGYNLHALSRVGLAIGHKYFGAHDWYRVLSKQVVLSQAENGSWGKTDAASADTLIDTAYTVLFLARGRHPVLMNKLRLDTPAVAEGPGSRIDRGPWNNRPRDLANLTAFASRELERSLNWQVVSIDRDPSEWTDAPILYLATSQIPALGDGDLKKFRAFAMQGGMLFTHADNNSEAFNLVAGSQLAKQLFPEYTFADLPADAEVYTCHYLLPAGKRAKLRGVHNGARYLWMHSPTDLAMAWQQRAEKTRRELFELGVNLYVYAAGKTELRNRIEARAIPPLPLSAAPATFNVPLLRLRYTGAWDPEPQAFPRFARYLRWETGVELEVKVADLFNLPARDPKATVQIAHLTGTTAWTPAEKEIEALSAFVNAGGTLIVEAIGPANSGFADSIQSVVFPKAFGGARFEALGKEHPMMRASLAGMEDVWAPRVRPYAAAKIGVNQPVPPIRQATVGRGRVIYLPLDVSSGLLGTGTWSIFGYEPAEAQALMKNIVVWCAENAQP